MPLADQDRQAIIDTASKLKVDPNSLGGLIQLESGFRPNVWGGAGGKYKGLIQFGPGARAEVGLPDRDMTIAEQMPYVEKYFQQRGFKPGEHGVTELYRTVLVGNPYQSGTDSFGTNSDTAADRMRPGGDLYAASEQVLGETSASTVKRESDKTDLGQSKEGSQPASILEALALLRREFGLSDNERSSTVPASQLPSSEETAGDIIKQEEASLGQLLQQMSADEKAESDARAREEAAQKDMLSEVARSKAAAALLAQQAMAAFKTPQSLI